MSQALNSWVAGGSTVMFSISKEEALMEDYSGRHAKEPCISSRLRPVSPGIFLGLKHSSIQKLKLREGGSAKG